MTIKRLGNGWDEPFEYVVTNPVNCVICGQEWDADDQYGEEFVEHEDTNEVVCRGVCYSLLNERLEGETDNEIYLEEAA